MRATPVHARSGFSALAAMLAVFSMAGSAGAQDRGSTQTDPRKNGLCIVFAGIAPAGQPQSEAKPLRALCGGKVVLLGAASSFEAVKSEALNATLIDTRLGTERRVLLITVQDNGEPLVEVLNSQIARTAGRGPMSDLDGIDIDFRQFARTGELGVRGGEADRARARADRIALGPQVAQERTRRKGRAAHN